MKKYKVNFEMKAILLDSDYNQAVKFASDLMNEPIELSPYHVSNILVSMERLDEPSQDEIKAFKDFILYQLKANDRVIVKSLEFKNVEILY